LVRGISHLHYEDKTEIFGLGLTRLESKKIRSDKNNTYTIMNGVYNYLRKNEIYCV